LKILLHIAEGLGLIMVLCSALIIWDAPVWWVSQLITDLKERREENRKALHSNGTQARAMRSHFENDRECQCGSVAEAGRDRERRNEGNGKRFPERKASRTGGAGSVALIPAAPAPVTTQAAALLLRNRP
jgi:hypothetical protein